MAIRLSNNRAWLERMAKAEDYGAVSAGGLLARASAESQKKGVADEPKVIGKQSQRQVRLAKRRMRLKSS